MWPCGWLPGTTLWIATARDRCGGAPRPQGSLVVPCLPLEGAGAFGVLLVQPGQELRVSQECLHPGFAMGLEVLAFARVPEGVLCHDVCLSCAHSAPVGVVPCGVSES